MTCRSGAGEWPPTSPSGWPAWACARSSSARSGEDFADYRSWLERHGVDCTSVHYSESRHTARFICTTDNDMAQIATFYAGAMTEARDIELAPVADRVGASTSSHRRERPRGDAPSHPGVPDPRDPVHRGPVPAARFADGPEIRRLVDGAAYLFTNEYEAHLTEQKTGWTARRDPRRVDVRVITRGSEGVTIHRKGEDVISVPVAREVRKADPTGVGDAFRAGSSPASPAGLDAPVRRAGLDARDLRHRDGGHAGVRPRQGALPRAARRGLRAESAAEIEPHIVCHRP